jgi:amino acid transporter
MSSSANSADLTGSSANLPRRPRSGKSEAAGFGMFGGVFTPCTLTILGVIMFLRFGYVVGNAGLFWALMILLAAKVITTLTTLSLSAVATNTKVKGGGAYFLISRSLGVEFGGAIGIVFFLAQAISVAMYVIGFTEVLHPMLGGSIGEKPLALLTNLAVFTCVYIGASWTIKVQYFILATLVLSLVSFFSGGIETFQWSTLAENWTSHYTTNENGNRESLFTMFALFFPAVTGIMAGANMSGDLRNPSKSIPQGTLWSILATAIVYAVMAVFLAGCQSAEALVSQKTIVSTISKWPLLITAGVFAATLSSALGSMMGAPRILQALAKDKIFPRLQPFASGSGPSSEPRRAVILTFVISSICIVAADLNTIAPFITMAFMITYGTINIATFYEGITKNPSYRPTFRYSHWTTSLAGAVGCISVMLLMNPILAGLSGLVMTGVYFFIYRKKIANQFGDINSGLLFERTRKNLLKLERTLYHPKNWRPIVLAMSGGGYNRLNLSMYGYWLTQGNGILNIGQVISGNAAEQTKRIANQEQILEKFITEEELDAFPNIVAAPCLSDGIEYLIQCSGLGALRPNTLLLGWPGDTDKASPLVATMRTVQQLGRNIVIGRFGDSDDDPKIPPAGTIDVWWRGRKNGELMLLFAHLLKQNAAWRNHTIRLMRVVTSEEAKSEVLNHLNELANESRIEIQARVFVSDHPHHVIGKQSKDSAITILGFELPEPGREKKFFNLIEQLTERLPRTLLVSSIGNVKLES